MFAKKAFEELVEINFEFSPNTASLFTSRSPDTIIPLLESIHKTRIIPGKTLLFLDEIQAAPEVFACLRFFYEKMPELHVICAGSLLEFVLNEHSFSMPVGRIEYLHLGPMCFEEFLMALGRDSFLNWLRNYSPVTDVPSAVHEGSMRLAKQYMLTGGVPDAIKAFAVKGGNS